MFEATQADLVALEAELDRMGDEAEAEIAAEQKAEDERIAAVAAGKPSQVVVEDDVDPFEHQKRRETEHREAMKAKAKE